MMNCERIESQLIVYLDAKAKPAERRQVESHLAECAACRQRVDEFRLVAGLLDELPMIAPSPSFDAALRERVAAEPRRSGLWGWMIPSPRLAFAVTALLICSIWLTSMRPVHAPVAAAVQQSSSETEFSVINNLPVLEDFDVVSNFDALSELPVQQTASPAPAQHPNL
jgi:anti-sigma factor RsiW